MRFSLFSSRLFLPAAAFWTLAVGASLIWNVEHDRRQVMDRAYSQARLSLERDIVFRRWATRHGGVYVRAADNQETSPWLNHVPDREVTTTDGHKLTLLNPNAMMRQMAEARTGPSGVLRRITGLRYLNPANAPDAWESTQLQAFARRENQEAWAVADFEGKPHLRYLRALNMEPGCDKCHAILGYKTGDVRGGLEVNIPLDAYQRQIDGTNAVLGGTHGGIWLLGLAGLVAAMRSAGKREGELRASERRFRDLFDNSPDPCWLIEGHRFTDCNHAAVRTLGYGDRADLLKHPSRLSPEFQPDGQASFEKAEAMMRTAQENGVHRFEWEHRRADGSTFPVEVTLARLDMQAGGALYCVWRDITERKRADEELRSERDRSQLYLNTVQSVMVALDARGNVTMINAFGCALLGYSAAQLVGRNWFETCLPQPEGKSAVLPYFELLMTGKAEDREYHENRLLTAGGQEVLVAWRNALLRDENGQIIGTLSAGEDITERRAAEEAAHNLAFFDPVTALPNRRLLIDRLQQSMASSLRSAKYRALLYVDLDHFKKLNDNHGHQIGDRLLIESARRLRACVRESDTVSRIGGDEFVLLLEQLSTDPEQAAMQAGAVGEMIIARLGEAYDLGVDIYRGTTSLGITLFVGQEASVEDLLKRADLAMYQAKAAGRNALRFFEPAMQANIAIRAALETELRRAVDRKEFTLHYQPQVDQDAECVGVEALLRWNNPRRGMVPPLEFIPLAEETGLILPIGEWVMREACVRLSEWQRDPITADLSVAVNVSPRQFRDPRFVDHVRDLLLEFGINPSLLKLEITESMLVQDIDDVVAKMLSLKGLGLSFSLDDFGTGYSSLTYVKRLPIAQLKIDKSFVRDLLVDQNDAAICRAIIALGDSLGLHTIAEGVESARQWKFLSEAGCGGAQGYLYAKPMPAGEFLAWLRKREPA